jgi:hypothetical protein
LRAFHLSAKKAVTAHPSWNGCAADRRCEVWTVSDEARARQLAHEKFWQEATPADPDQTSPWTDPAMVVCDEIPVPPHSVVPVNDTVFIWGDRILRAPSPQPQQGQTPAANADPTKKLDQH